MFKNIVYIFGVPGAGKTTILSDFVINNKDKVEYINFGDIFYELAKIEAKIKDRDEMRYKLDRISYENIFNKAVEKLELLVLESDKKLIIIDTHLIIKTNFGLFIGTPSRLIKKIPPTALVVIKAKAKDVLERRKRDISRKRELESEEKLEEMIRNVVSLAFTVAYHSSSILQIINNDQGRLEESKDKINKFLGQFIN